MLNSATSNDGVSLWQNEAVCKGANSEIFSPDRPAKDKRYKDYCNRCPVKAQCLDEALIYGHYGVWGGTDDKERRKTPGSVVELIREDYTESGLYNTQLKVS